MGHGTGVVRTAAVLFWSLQKPASPRKGAAKLHFSWEAARASHQAWFLRLTFLCMLQLTGLWTWLNIHTIHLIPVFCNWTPLGVYLATGTPKKQFLWILCSIFLKHHRVLLPFKKKISMQLSCFSDFAFKLVFSIGRVLPERMAGWAATIML